MGDYNLAGLNPREFEHLVQALAAKIVAPGVRIFGDGRDGGREATYEGPMAYPSAASPWDGYLVVQAKFLQRPGQAGDQGDWALGQLRTELQKYRRSVGGPRTPDYFIFATNAVLTPVAEAGSIDRANALLDEYSGRIGLRGHEIWHFDTICRHLDGQAEIRTRYAGLISTGDVLAKVFATLQDGRPEFLTVMVDFLQKQLVADQYVKLGQAGYAAEGKTTLAQAFVDLVATEERLVEPPGDPPEGLEGSPGGFVALMLEEVGQTLDPSTLWGRAEARRSVSPSPGSDSGTTEPDEGPMPGRHVLVGGPGQGKTTLGQYLCQLHRAALLDGRPPYTLSPGARRACREVLEQGKRDGLDLHGARRYPVRVVLSRFADELAKGSATSLLGYIAATVAFVSDRAVGIDDLRSWMAGYPWLLVLDGLDEVPSSGNRTSLMAAIDDFWAEVAASNADVFVVATTRPQGYEREFSPGEFRHRHLAPLSPSRAIRYAEKLVASHHQADADGVNRVLDVLKKECVEPSTGRLMRTPLQVTIMALLVDRLGDPPRQRWPLFQKYFEVIYDRELLKDHAVTPLLRGHRKDIEAIHRRAGLRLQLDGEQAGASEASLARAEFEALVRARLAEAGHDGEGLGVLAIRIADAAMERLVFLVAPIEGRVGFEVRSLQEFMASEALVDGSDDQVGGRLRDIAPLAYWRNTLLFAAGHRAARREYDFGAVLAICDELNEAEPFGRISLSGSRLALDLLEDGVARELPRYQRSLTRKALRLLHLPPDVWIDRLAGLIEPATEVVFFEEIGDRLGQADVVEQLGAWELLHHLAESGIARARSLFDSRWPADAARCLEICRALARRPDRWAPIERLVEIAPHISYQAFRTSGAFRPLTESERATLPDWFVAVASTVFGRNRHRDGTFVRVALRLGQPEGLHLDLVTVGDGPHRSFADVAKMPAGHPAWLPLVAAARFVGEPSSGSLAAALRALADQWGQRAYPVAIPAGPLPWPLAESIQASNSADDFADLAMRAEAGELGDLADWVEAEQRWAGAGMDRDSLAALARERWPFDRDSLRRGLPFRRGRARLKLNYPGGFDPEPLMTFRGELPPSRLRSEVAGLILEGFGGLIPTSRLPPPGPLLALIRDAEGQDLDLSIFARLRPEEAVSEEWGEMFDLVGSRDISQSFMFANSPLPDLAADLLASRPGRRGLVKLLGALVVLGYDVPPIAEVLLPDVPADETYSWSFANRWATAIK